MCKSLKDRGLGARRDGTVTVVLVGFSWLANYFPQKCRQIALQIAAFPICGNPARNK
jgi:hypothetical protein